MNNKSTFSLLLTVWLCHFAVDFMIGIWPIYKTMMQMDLALVGIITAVGVCLGEGMQLLFGALSDSGHRRIVLLGGILATLAAVLYPYATTLSYIFPLFALTCIGSGAFHPAACSLVTSLSSKRRALYATIFTSGGMAGMATSQLIFTHTHQFFSGHTFILAFPTLCLLFYIGFRATLSAPEQENNHRPPAFNLNAVREFFHKRELVYLYIIQVANQSVFWALVFLLPDVFKSRETSSWVASGGGHLIFIAGCASMMIPGGYFADKYSPKSVLFVATFTGVMWFYALLFSPDLSEQMLLTLLFFLGASLGVSNPVTVAFGNSLMPNNPGVVSAVLMGLVWVVAEGVGPGGAGVLSTYFTDDAPAKALMVVGVLYFAALYVIPKLPATSQRSEEQVLAA